MNDTLSIPHEIASQVNVKGAYWWRVTIGSGNGLVLLGNKPLPVPMVTKIHGTMDNTRGQWVNSVGTEIWPNSEHYKACVPGWNNAIWPLEQVFQISNGQ